MTSLKNILSRLIAYEKALSRNYDMYSKTVNNAEIRETFIKFAANHQTRRRQLEILLKKYCSG